MKACLIIGPAYALNFEEPYNLAKEGVLKGGVLCLKWQLSKDKPNAIAAYWYTTLATPNKKKLVLTKRYHHELYPHYDNYNAIEVGRIKDIPYDYDCVMGVPITIFQYDLDNVEVLKCLNDNTPDTRTATVEGKEKYCRVLIKKKDCDNGGRGDTQ